MVRVFRGCCSRYPILRILYHTLGLIATSHRNLGARLLRAKIGKEIHLERIGEFRRRAEGEVHVLAQHLGDVRPRHFHTPGKFRMRNAQLFHPPQDTPQKCRAYPVYRSHVNAPRPRGMQPNTSLDLNRLYLTGPLRELPIYILTFWLTDCKHKHITWKLPVCPYTTRSVLYVINSEGLQKTLRYRCASAPHGDNRIVRIIDWKKVFLTQRRRGPSDKQIYFLTPPNPISRASILHPYLATMFKNIRRLGDMTQLSKYNTFIASRGVSSSINPSIYCMSRLHLHE